LTNKELDNLIICRKCQAIHTKPILKSKEIARCSECGEVLYEDSKDTFTKSFALSITALILYIVAASFPIIKVYVLAQESDLTIFSMLYYLFNEGFIVVGTVVLVVIVIVPLLLMLSFILIGILSHFRLAKNFVRAIIAFIIHIRAWSMVDIFFISILVALVKLFGYADVGFGVSFVALILFVVVELIAMKSIKPVELWQLYKRVYGG